MSKIYTAFLLCCFAGCALAGDGKSTIDLTFSGSIVSPSCVIAFEDNSNTKTVSFADVNVSEMRYYNGGDVDTYSYSQTKSSGIFNLKISGCTPAQVSSNSNGKQFTFSITPGAGSEWVEEGGNNNYMMGAIAPKTGATDFAAKIMVPSTFPTSAAPTQWHTLTKSGLTGRADSSTDDAGPVSDLGLSFSDLISTGSGSSQAWLMPMKVKLGMRTQGMDGKTVGQFAISAIVTVSYF